MKHAPGASRDVVQNHGVQRLLAIAIPLEARVSVCGRLRAGCSGGGALQRGAASLDARPQLGNVRLYLVRRRGRPLYEASQ